MSACRPKPAGLLSSLLLAGYVWLGTGLFAKASESEAAAREAFLKAIAEVESGGNALATGRYGERGLYQFRRMTWRQHTLRPFREAYNPSAAHVIAVRHYEWLHERFVRNGREPTPYLLAAAWNAGLSHTLSGEIPSSTRNYALRVTALMADFLPKGSPDDEMEPDGAPSR